MKKFLALLKKYRLLFLIMIFISACSSNPAANTIASQEKPPERIELSYRIKIKCPGITTIIASDSEHDPIYHEGSRKVAALGDYFTVKGNVATIIDVPEVGIDIPISESCTVTKEEGAKKYFVSDE